MADRPTQRLRRIDSESDDFEGADVKDSSYVSSAPPTATTTRPRRGTASQAHPAAVIERSSPEDTRQSIHLTVKAPPNKLRKATNGSVVKTAVSSRNIVTGKRARNSRVIRDVSDDEDEDEEPEPKDLDDDAEEEEDDDAEGEEDDDVDAEGEEDDEMDDVTPAPRIIVSNNESLRKSGNNASKPQDKVEAAEMALGDDDDDDELSELDSEEEAEDEDAEGEDEDAEGEEDDELAAQNDEDENEDMDSDDEDRDQTPDLSKLTRRQRAMHVEDSDGGLMALSNEAQKKKHLTAEEHAMRRAEMARRRKNLSEKRNEEEKMDTINRLLKKQPPKRGRKVVQENVGSGEEEEPEVEKANPLYVRYIQNAAGTRMGVPEEWLQAPVGSMFAGSLPKASSQPFGGKMVQEVA